jgi:fructoselysine transporter
VPVVLVVRAIDDLPAVLGAESPIIALLQRASGPTVAMLVTAGVVAAIFNAMIAAIMGFGRFIYATGRDGVWSSGINRVLSRLHPRFQSPIGATAVLVLLACACCFLSERRLLILISGNVADYALVGVALLIGRKQGRTGKDYGAPLHPVLPLFGISITGMSIFADWMDPDAGRPSMLLLIGVFIVALGYFELRRRQGKEIVISGAG